MYIGVDIGGTKTLVACFSADGKLEDKVRFETPKEYSAFLDNLRQELYKIINGREIRSCVVGAPGKIDRISGIGVRFGNLDWKNVPLKDDVESIINKPVSVENDANLAGLYEANVIREKYRNSYYLTISTGIGGGSIRDGFLDESTLDTEPGHMMFEHKGNLEKWESFGSGKAVFNEYGKRASDIEDRATWEKICHNLVPGFLAIAAIATPEVIIIGGGMGAHLSKFKEILEDQLRAHASPMISLPDLVSASLPEDCVIYGCYTLASQKYEASQI